MSDQTSIERTYLRLVLTMAASFQGGHCMTAGEARMAASRAGEGQHGDI